MKRAIIFTLCSLAATVAAARAQEPLEQLFHRSARELGFQIPSGFQPASDAHRYLKPDAREVPRWQRMWQHGSDGILVNVIVIPDAAWKTKSPTQMFTEGLAAMLTDPTLKIVSQRSYEFRGAPATSITCYYNTPGGTSQRMDCFLVEPNMFMVAYISAKSFSWEDPASKAFFETLSLKPK